MIDTDKFLERVGLYTLIKWIRNRGVVIEEIDDKAGEKNPDYNAMNDGQVYIYKDRLYKYDAEKNTSTDKSKGFIKLSGDTNDLTIGARNLFVGAINYQADNAHSITIKIENQDAYEEIKTVTARLEEGKTYCISAETNGVFTTHFSNWPADDTTRPSNHLIEDHTSLWLVSSDSKGFYLLATNSNRICYGRQYWIWVCPKTDTYHLRVNAYGSPASNIGKTYKFWNFQVEEASQPSAWRPAVEDMKGMAGANGVTPTIKVASGANINSVGTPSVTANTVGTTTTFTFNNLKGATGATGKTIKDITQEYALVPSTSSFPQGFSPSWSTTIPSLSLGMYMWRREKITFTDGTTATSSPYYDRAINDFYYSFTYGHVGMEHTHLEMYETTSTPTTPSGAAKPSSWNFDVASAFNNCPTGKRSRVFLKATPASVYPQINLTNWKSVKAGTLYIENTNSNVATLVMFYGSNLNSTIGVTSNTHLIVDFVNGSFCYRMAQYY